MEKGDSKKINILTFKYILVVYLSVIFSTTLFILMFALSQNNILFHENTLYFFFSTIFQGFSALLGILIMGMIFYREKLDNEISRIKEQHENDFFKTDIYNECLSFFKGKKPSYKEVGEWLSQRLKDDKDIKVTNVFKVILGYAIKIIMLNLKKRYIKYLVSFVLFTILVVIVISGIALTLSGYFLINDVFWNVFTVSLTLYLSLFSLLNLGIMFYLIFFHE